MGGNMQTVTLSSGKSPETYADTQILHFQNVCISPVLCLFGHEGDLLAALNAPQSPRQSVLCDPPDPPGTLVCRDAAINLIPLYESLQIEATNSKAGRL